MPAKRKRTILDEFDPNKSDPEDENFEPGGDREESRPRRSNKRSRPTSKAKTLGRRRERYAGSDIDEDDGEIVSDSAGGSFGESESEDDDDETVPINATGRRMRKAAAARRSYKESSDSEDEVADSDEGGRRATAKGGSKSKQGGRSHLVTLKINPKNTRAARAISKEPPTPSVTTRRTRAHTEDAEDFLELTTSGRHAQANQRSTRAGTKSKSPEAFTRAGRSTRGGKGLKKPPQPIEEATQENSAHDGRGIGGDGAFEDSNGHDAQAAQGNDGAVVDSDAEQERADVEASAAADDVDAEREDDGADNNGDNMDEDDAAAAEDHGAGDDEDEDVVAPVTHRTRASKAGTAVPPADEAEDQDEDAAPTRRLRRRDSRKEKSMAEPSSDFEPAEDSGEGEEEASAVSDEGGTATRRSGRKRADTVDDGDEEYSSHNSRGRRASQSKRVSKRRSAKESADEELDLDQNELAEELEELRQSSRSRQRRRRSPEIAYEQLPKRRRVTRVVDYSIKPLDQLVDQEEEEDQAPTPARGGRRGGRNGASNLWQRNLASTYGPFGGGGGLGSLLGGPWGKGTTGGVESDSSDDEAAVRPFAAGGVGGNVGMTPTTAAALPALGQPLNLESITGVAATPNLGKVKNQKAFADADPLGVDLTVDFSKVGGLQGHIDQLKEMITLPLLYPELFLKYKVTPPRGVLFHGPPGTGKTLLARALSNAVGIGGRKITFYMRKGADALSKWVGEAEKQLRLLFEEARRTQPSIIFFDEIDGLAPVRSSKQEQIHASIVSTLLALMDGMDGRGQVIVIGATNRPDSVDPALRRPGRFDREFYFPLPDVEGRRAILDIHTRDWGLSEEFRNSLAQQTKGYGGADLRALCTEAALNSIQRTYPQIYSSTEKLVVDPDRISVHATDFMLSMKKMVPSSQRSASSAAAPLPPSVEPLLRHQLASVVRALDLALPRRKKITALEEAMFEPYEDDDHGFGRERLNQEFERLRIFRPRLLISGPPGMGQEYISAAVLHHLEGVHIQNFDLATLVGDGAPLEQVIVRLFIEVKRHKPAVIFIPNIEAWYATVPEPAYRTFVTMLRSIPATDPVMLLATTEDSSNLAEDMLRDLFKFSHRNILEISRPNTDDRREYFSNIVSRVRLSPTEFPDPSHRRRRVLEVLDVAPPPPVRERTKEEIERELHQDHIYLNILKVQLQPIMDQIKQKYRKFRNSVIPMQQIEYLWLEADPSYVRADVAPDPATAAGAEGVGADGGPADPARPFVIARDKDGVEGLREVATGRFFYNLDLATIEERLSNGYYARPMDFFNDIEALAKDARNIGDRERTLKANELVSNVRVDVHEVGVRLQSIDFNALYERQRQRAQQAEEKRRKREAMQMVVDLVRPDIEMQDADGGAADGGLVTPGPVRIGAPLPLGGGALVNTTTRARFRVMSPVHSNGDASGLSNGNSVPSRAAAAVGEDDANSTQHASQMGPPPPGSRISGAVSQVCAVTTVPPGMSPSAIVNDASTTRSTDVSGHGRLSDRFSTQATNGSQSQAGGLGSHAAANASQLPDTQSLPGGGPTQSTSSESQSQWAHSQAQGIARGELQPRTVVGGRVTAAVAYGSPVQATPSSSLDIYASSSSSGPRSSVPASAAASRRQAVSMVNLVNETGPLQQRQQTATAAGSTATRPSAAHGGDVSSSASSSARHQQAAIPIPEGEAEVFLETLTVGTSGCTVDQLEQVARELMFEVWATRNEFNRPKVLQRLGQVFNDTMKDIESTQGELILDSTQEERTKRQRHTSVRFGGGGLAESAAESGSRHSYEVL